MNQPPEKVNWRGGFADRNNYEPINREMQFESLDDRTRKTLFLAFKSIMWKRFSYNLEDLSNFFYRHFYIENVDFVNSFIFFETIEATILRDEWYHVFDFVEFWCIYEKKHFPQDTFYKYINALFKKEFVGYRLINSEIVPITDENEIQAIETGLSNPHDEVSNHLSKALSKLSDRANPDYENSIKESISAVEAMVKIIADDKKATLSSALKKIEEKGIPIHPQLQEAFKALFNYTSDSSGVRHSNKLGGTRATFEEAQFMLVTCSAFTNYLLSNFGKNEKE